ncbi:condensin-2 complex subunit H2 isoform X2 [Catharus ustulatus]|uniref:condensin-2 complex subunit H2 isoform X2 n=1 Tax=Catharus ustulatus TaxID=91951 RepID=UPI00140B272D|nr:condensin-2 complex subunit H2 isoform X2 [Catharus ustulatus]
MEGGDSRFLHLHQPIRDLTKNWEVDVASQLGEYLEELDQICISFDNGKTTMNFMEAALLIQGSACIYSKKVEHLYMLVCQALDCISNKKRQRLPCSVGPDGRDADATFTDREQEFLSLDDIPETSQARVDTKRSQQVAAVTIVPLTPMSLEAPDEGEKEEDPLMSRQGEVLAGRRDFRMNVSSQHASGTFLQDPAGLSPAGMSPPGLSPARMAPPLHEQGTAPGSTPSAGTVVRALSFCEEPGAADDDDAAGALGQDMEVTPGQEEHIEAQRSTPRTRGYILRDRAPRQEPKPQSKEEPNPWQSLDPFGDSEEKPFRKGRPFLVPQGLDDIVGGKRKRRGPRKLQDFMRWFSAAYNNVTEEKTRRRGPSFADLEVLYWRHFKERAAAHRKLRSSREPRWEPEREPEPELELEPERGADGEEGADDDFVEHEDVEPEAVPEELREGSLDPPEFGYEELVRKNVELFIASSQKFVQETELSRHIRHWQEHVKPLLQEQEERAPFDVRAYGQSLTQRCAEPGRWHSLASLVAGQPPFEVCRYLLASLQLANDAEVELAQDAGLEAALDTARLRRLSARPAHERFQNFQLPSQSHPDPQ